MKAFNEFIVCIPEPYQDSITTENGVKIFISKQWSIDKCVNRIGTVISTPINFETEIKEGFHVVIDPTILYEQRFALTHGLQDSIFLVDKEKSLYKINPSMVVLYRENEEEQWKGHGSNSLMERVEIKEQEEPVSKIIIMEAVSKKYETNKARLVYGNSELLNDAKLGDELIVEEMYGVAFPLEGKEYLWYRNEDVKAILN